MLRAFAERLGARAEGGELAAVERSEDGRRVMSVTTTAGTRVIGEFFVDCTGAPAALLGEALGVPFDSWQPWLPCDHAVVLRTRTADTPAPFTRITAQPAGFAWQVPLRGALQQALIFDGRRRDPRSVLSQVPAQGEALGPARSLRFTNGRRREFWRGNCVAVGAAAGFLEPLLSTGLRLVDEGITQLIALFPDRDTACLADEYNRTLGAAYDGARDFAILHYLPGQPVESLPATLRQRLELFRYRGRVVLHDGELFEEPEWACAFLGLGERPQHHSILTEQMTEDEALAQVAKIARLMQGAVQKLPSHQAYLERYLA
jgi:tryptophan halogenase